ncbi:1838_t:CDS:2, partial [Ambispora leptoticha]
SPYPPNELSRPEIGTFIDNKIIFFDSYDFGINNTKAFFLDLSVNWTTSTPAFIKINDLFNVPMFDYTTFSALNKSGLSLIYAYGGLIPINFNSWNTGTFVSDFYKIDVTSYPFSISPVRAGSISPGPRSNHNSIFDDKGKLYIWGGKTVAKNGSYINDQTMYIFDTFNSTWSQVLPSDAPDQRSSYSATFKDGKIYFIGGCFSNIPGCICVDIYEILVYDTLDINNPWTIKKATSDTSISYISGRYVHSAVLAPNNQSIILYGGLTSNASGIPPDYLISLDLQTFKFSMIVTKNESSIDDVSFRTTIVIYNNYMIACFGVFFTKNPNRKVIRVLDLKDYTWVDNFETQVSNSTTTPAPTPTFINNDNKKIIIFSTVGPILVIILVGFIAFLFYNYKRKQKQPNIDNNTATHNSLTENNNQNNLTSDYNIRDSYVSSLAFKSES